MSYRLKSGYAFTLATLICSLGFAFSQEDCGDIFPKISDKHPPYMSPLYTTTMPASTTSYLSSWGKCSMYGYSQTLEREIFVAEAYTEISRQAAQGTGEHITTLAMLSGCPVALKSEFNKHVQAHYPEVFDPSVSDPRQITQKLDSVIQLNGQLHRSCRMLD